MVSVLRLLSLFLLTYFLIACTHLSEKPVFYGTGKKSVEPFHAVSIHGDVDVYVEPSPSLYEVMFTSEQKNLKKLNVEVKNKELFLSYPKDFSPNKLSVVIHTPQLDEFTYSGLGEVHIRDLHAHNLRLKVLENGLVRINGHGKELHATVTGHARLNARCFYADTVYVNTTGFGQAEVRNHNGLSALAADYSDIYYYQDPHGQFPYVRGSGAVLRMVGLEHCH